jgi:hypothetical protein
MTHKSKYNLSKAMMLSSNLTKISNASPDLRKDDGLIQGKSIENKEPVGHPNPHKMILK